jgi:hypothetical protein
MPPFWILEDFDNLETSSLSPESRDEALIDTKQTVKAQQGEVLPARDIKIQFYLNNTVRGRHELLLEECKDAWYSKTDFELISLGIA